jgi:4-methoxybenzoate monooxygenase (O-demethylating)
LGGPIGAPFGHVSSRSGASLGETERLADLNQKGVAVLDFDPFSAEVLAAPETYDALARERAPVCFLTRYNVWVLARHQNVQAAFADWNTFSSAAGTGLAHIRRDQPWRTPSPILESDPPGHTGFRRVMSRVLSAGTVAWLRAEFQSFADQLVERLLQHREFDAVKDLAEVFPFHVVPTALGIPMHGRDLMLIYSELNFNSMGPDNWLQKSSRERAAPILQRVAEMCRREALSDDGLGARIYDECASEGLTADDASLLVRTFFSASMDTTVNGIGFTIQSLCDSPDQWAMLSGQPSLARRAFEESLRHRSPSPYIGRTTTREVEIEGVKLGADEKVLLFVAAANRDPRKFTDPERFDINRSAAGHVAFGTGLHACVGQLVARLEGELVLEALARRAASVEIVGEPKYLMNNWLRGLTSLPVRATPKS